MTDEKMLNLRLFCRNITLDDRTKDYIVKRIQKLERFLEKSLEYEVEVSMDKKGKFTVEIMIQTPLKLFRATEVSESIEGSTDIAVEQIQRQIVKNNDRMRDLRERGARSIKKKIISDSESRFGVK